MNIQLTQRAAALLERRLAEAPEFVSPAELIEQALELFDERQSFDSLKAQVQAGLDDIAAGRVGPLDVEEIIREGHKRLAVS